MEKLVIRKFEHTDVEAFIRLSQTSFAEESVAAGITPEDFEQETRRIFRWKMIPYKLLTALMGVKWEAFVAEKDGKVVGGGMYIGRNNRMTLTNLMVEPAYRRQGIGQALTARRQERLAEQGFSYVTAQVLDTNTASLENLKKQGFEVFNQYSEYEHTLPLPQIEKLAPSPGSIREVARSDQALFREIEKNTTPPLALKVNGSAETHYFLAGAQRLYARFTGYSKWIRAVVVQGKTIGFLSADFQQRQSKGLLLQPVVADEHLQVLPAMISAAGAWLEASQKTSMIIEVSGHRKQMHEYLVSSGWKKQYTWLELIRWLDERAREEFIVR